MANNKVSEIDGLYTVHQLVIRRGDNGKLYEAAKRVHLSFPPLKEEHWPDWAKGLTEDELDINLQIFFDRFNFGLGRPEDGRIYTCLHDERDRRRNTFSKNNKKNNPPLPAL